jgi:hypothetical protein
MLVSCCVAPHGGGDIADELKRSNIAALDSDELIDAIRTIERKE